MDESTKGREIGCSKLAQARTNMENMLIVCLICQAGQYETIYSFGGVCLLEIEHRHHRHRPGKVLVIPPD